MFTDHISAAVSEDITQEAMRRIAENVRKAEEVAREKTIRAHMQKLEYDALPKCAHGLPSDAKTWLDHCARYHSEYYHSRSVPPWSTQCPQCVNEAHVKKQKEEADKAAAVAIEAKRITAERDRQANIARAKHAEEKMARLQSDRTTLLNFVSLVEPAWTAETYYLRLEDGGKYVPIADGVHVTGRPMLGELSKAPVPTQWATHFTDGLIPFLPICPCCAACTQMIAAATVSTTTNVTIRERYIRSVECGECDADLQVSPRVLKDTYGNVLRVVEYPRRTHYKWEALSGKHYKNGVEWDPLDPDGAKAAAQSRAAELAAAEKQMAELQAKIQQLKAASDRH